MPHKLASAREDQQAHPYHELALPQEQEAPPRQPGKAALGPFPKNLRHGTNVGTHMVPGPAGGAAGAPELGGPKAPLCPGLGLWGQGSLGHSAMPAGGDTEWGCLFLFPIHCCSVLKIPCKVYSQREYWILFQGD